jgi:hypothetical protein
MKTIPTKQTKSQRLFLSRILLITGSILLTFCSYQSVFAQDYDFQQGDDVDYLVVMEAENFSENTPVGDVMWALTDSPEDFSGEGAMMAVTGGAFATKESAMEGSAIMTYKINFTESGIHYIWARACRMVGPSDDSYHAGIDGVIGVNGEMLTFHTTDFENGTWGWINYRNNIEPGYVEIPSAGVHTLDIYIRENGFRIDKIILTPSDTSYFKPDGMGPDETLPVEGPELTPATLDDNLFTISQNPIQEELTVIIGAKQYQTGRLEVISLQGKVLKSHLIENDSQIRLNMSDLRSGLYFVKLELDNRSVLIKKFVKE